MNRRLRAIFLFLAISLFYIISAARLIEIQIIDNEEYKFFADRQQKEVKKVEAERGIIYDRYGETLAYNEQITSFYVDLRMLKTKNKDLIADKFSSVFNKKKTYYLNLMNSNARLVFLERNVPKEKAIQIKNNLFFDELGTIDSYKRKYPYGELAAFAIGYTNDKNEGVDGIEKYYNEKLKGKDGFIVYFRDVQRRVVSLIEKESNPAIKGNDIYLTIDRKIQYITEDEIKNATLSLKAKGAIAIIMDVDAGEILALAIYPSYNLNEYYKYDNEARRNKALTDTYEPGSTFKSFVMSLALDENKVDINDKIFCENGTYLYNKLKINDVKKLGMIQIREAFENSSNIAMAKISENIEPEIFYRRLRDFGFGNYTRIDLPGETSGLLKTPSSFSKTTKAFMAFGYEVGVTPIQILNGFSSIVNGGFLKEPICLKKIIDSNGKVVFENEARFVRRTISKKTSELMISLLRGVVERGTAIEANSKLVTIIGKTGTSQKLDEKGYSKANYYASFIGAFPMKKPKYAGIVLLDSPQLEKYGGKAAAPVFRRIAERIAELYPENFKPVSFDNEKIVLEFFDKINDAEDKAKKDLKTDEKLSSQKNKTKNNYDSKKEHVSNESYSHSFYRRKLQANIMEEKN